MVIQANSLLLMVHRQAIKGDAMMMMMMISAPLAAGL
jgi:hypothetical protein